MEGEIKEIKNKSGDKDRSFNVVTDADGNTFVLNRGANSIFRSLTENVACLTQEVTKRHLAYAEAQETVTRLQLQNEQLTTRIQEARGWNDKWQAERKKVEELQKIIGKLNEELSKSNSNPVGIVDTSIHQQFIHMQEEISDLKKHNDFLFDRAAFYRNVLATKE